jgi:hypothetical protein
MYLPATDRDGEIIEFDASKAEDQADRDRRAEDAFNRSVQAQVYEEGEGADEAAAGGDVYRAQARKVPRRKPPLFAGFDDEESLSGLIKPVVMPEGVKIVSVRTADDLAAISEGEGSIYFFPRGRTQQAHILLEDEQSDAKWTIKVSPLTGRVTIEDGHDELVLPDDRSEQEDELGRRIERRTL